eukprot:CAMPEP_0175075570 /NCGR_PEP_ID=MMETSP0052_2-20121109/22095_1 /TAXON_ID=51329 ORGANISM="Polytomella parva, Strain SAG 63-3" /NCGR_SAMPLE_ID=MMETSP0052_2 /ASSEMBLY_ACC=CAM_ASM_000194 /LENGTH=93 /DNA_ID=CAMNT_0016344313 /DNA_START=513 /DNA_END=794 /DNA_ORIENTATION=-
MTSSSNWLSSFRALSVLQKQPGGNEKSDSPLQDTEALVITADEATREDNEVGEGGDMNPAAQLTEMDPDPSEEDEEEGELLKSGIGESENGGT